jgi:MSHA biogenesis protein MshP
MKPRSAAAGMALIAAIFLIVALAALGASMASLSNVEHDTGGKSLQSAKVYYGARAGLEWGIQQAIGAGASCAGSWGPGSNPMQGALSDVSVAVTCTTSTYGGSNNVYSITSVATVGTLGQLSYAERHLSASVSNIP